MIVLDASVVLATVFGEPGRIDLSEVFDSAAMSTVNFSEVVAKLQERDFDKEGFDFVTGKLAEICHPLTARQAFVAGEWRRQTRRLGLSTGDRCCLALALDLGAEVYTADRAWAGLDLGVKVRVVR